MSETERQEMERALLEAGETVNVPTDLLRRWLRDYADAVDHRRRLDGYSARLAQVAADGTLGPSIILDDDSLLPTGSF